MSILGTDHNATFTPPGADKRFNTKDILLRFMNLLHPENAKLSEKIKTSLARLGDTIADLGRALHNPIPQIISTLEIHLGKPAKGSKGADLLNQLDNYKNHFAPNLIVQEASLKEIRDKYATQYQALVSKGSALDEPRLTSLKAEVENAKNTKWQAYEDQKENALENLKPIKEGVEKVSGKGPVTTPESEETPTPSTPPEAPTPG